MAMPRRPARAFSLVELVLMIALIGVLTAIGAPRYANSLALYRSQAAAQRVAADFNLARSRATASSLGQSIVFTIATNSYTLPGVTGLLGQSSVYTVSLSGEPYAATLLTASSPTVTFDRYGQPSTGATVTVRSGTYTQTVALNAVTGIASVQ